MADLFILHDVMTFNYSPVDLDINNGVYVCTCLEDEGECTCRRLKCHLNMLSSDRSPATISRRYFSHILLCTYDGGATTHTHTHTHEATNHVSDPPPPPQRVITGALTTNTLQASPRQLGRCHGHPFSNHGMKDMHARTHYHLGTLRRLCGWSQS